MDKITNPEVSKVFNNYPDPMRKNIMTLRQIILETAAEVNAKNQVEETLKWAEPSYLTRNGSTIRIDWKITKPDQYAIYFNCKTKLVDTFKELYGESFRFEGNRAIVFDKSDELPLVELKHCISLALSYHSIKHLSLLGA